MTLATVVLSPMTPVAIPVASSVVRGVEAATWLSADLMDARRSFDAWMSGCAFPP